MDHCHHCLAHSWWSLRLVAKVVTSIRIVVPLHRTHNNCELGHSAPPLGGGEQRRFTATDSTLDRSIKAILALLLVMPFSAVAQTRPAFEPPLQQKVAPQITPPSQAASGLVTIESDRQMADNATGIVTATGNVRITYPDQRVIATARQLQYYNKENLVVLSGDIDVIQTDGHSIRAEQLRYDINRERVLLTPAPGEQVVTTYKLNASEFVPSMSPAPVR